MDDVRTALLNQLAERESMKMQNHSIRLQLEKLLGVSFLNWIIPIAKGFHPKHVNLLVTSVYKDRQDNFHTILINGKDNPLCQEDLFLLHSMRSLSDSILLTGKILREEPCLTTAISSSPFGAEQQDFRSNVLHKEYPPCTCILSHQWYESYASHPIVQSASRLNSDVKFLFPSEAIIPSHHVKSKPPYEMVSVPGLGKHPRQALDYLHWKKDSSITSIEAGPSVVDQILPEIDGIVLSVFSGIINPIAKGPRSNLLQCIENGRYVQTHKTIGDEPDWQFTFLMKRDNML